MRGVMSKKVNLVRCENRNAIKNSIYTCLSQIDHIEKNVNDITIKPNLCYYWNSSTGYTTDPQVISALIDWARDRFGKDITIRIAEADGSAMRTKLAFKILGYEKLSKEKGVELYNLSEGPCIQEKTVVNDREIEFKLPQILKDTDLFINVPKLKLMQITRITCGMKNVFGCIATPRKIIYHPYLNEAIVGINKLLKPDITVVDGLVALAKFPIKLDLLMASNSAFATDWVASQIMRFNPERLEFLKIAAKEKIGDKKEVQVVGAPIDSFKSLFPKNPIIPTELLWSAEINLLRLYVRIVGDVLPPFIKD
jgi:uncharacterized protein (DUF362 family)